MADRNTFWHFGDSFCFGNTPYTDSSFGWYLAEKFNTNYLLKGVSGNNNHMIFSDMLQNDSNFKQNDIIFINWSFFHRGWYVDDNGLIQSTNKFFNENKNERINNDATSSHFLEKYEFILDYTLNYSHDSNIKLFNGMVNPYISSLYDRGIKVYSLFIRGSESLRHGNTIIKNTEYNINPKGTIEFNPSYFYWLASKGWKNEEDCHYTRGIQKELAHEIYLKIQDL